MKNRSAAGVTAVLAVLCTIWLGSYQNILAQYEAYQSSSSRVLLHADFDDKAIDMPIGTGGAEAGEPAHNWALASVRGAPFPSPCLEISDNSIYSTEAVSFEFLGNEEITSDIVVIEADLWFDSYNRYLPCYIREQGSAAKSFLSIYAEPNGRLTYTDANTLSSRFLGRYQPGRPYHLKLVFDMNTRRYDIWWDLQRVVTEESPGVYDRGVGSVIFGVEFDLDLDGRLYIDNITAVAGPCVMGDMNGDRLADLVDLVLLGNYLDGPVDFTGTCGETQADVDEDGDIDEDDYNLLFDIIAGVGGAAQK